MKQGFEQKPINYYRKNVHLENKKHFHHQNLHNQSQREWIFGKTFLHNMICQITKMIDFIICYHNHKKQN